MQYTRNTQCEFRDDRLKLSAVVSRHLKTAAHGTDRRIELTSAGVLERFSRAEERLLAHDAEATNLLDP